MTTGLTPIGNGVNRLSLRCVTPLALNEVDSWLYAIGMPPEQRETACRQIMHEGYYAVSNIEYKVTIECTKQ